MKKLTPRQYRLHDYLKTQYELDDKKWVSKKEIILGLAEFYNPNNEEYDDTLSAYRILRSDIVRLQKDETLQKLVISSKKGYKIANYDDLEIFLKRRKQEALNKLKIYHTLKKKAELNGQYRIAFTTHEKDIVESF